MHYNRSHPLTRNIPHETKMNNSHNIVPIPDLIFIIIVSNTNRINAVCILFAGTCCCSVSWPKPSIRPLLTTLFYVEARPEALVSSIGTFLRLPRFLQLVFSVGIGLSNSRNGAADFENSVGTIDELCASVIWLKLKGREIFGRKMNSNDV
ncbi:hypothetical protein TNCV_1957071 [Trichonephila clavipes]|nr:hypothetical protein TNCV_1957071 [Trichonephila clavipes]